MLVASQNWLDSADNWYFWWIVKLAISIAHVANIDRDRLPTWLKSGFLVTRNHHDTHHEVKLHVILDLVIITPPKIILNIRQLSVTLITVLKYAVATVLVFKHFIIAVAVLLLGNKICFLKNLQLKDQYPIYWTY